MFRPTSSFCERTRQVDRPIAGSRCRPPRTYADERGASAQWKVSKAGSTESVVTGLQHTVRSAEFRLVDLT